MVDYEQMYKELKRELRIHDSHNHEQTLAYVRVHNDKVRAAEQIVAKANSFGTEVRAIAERTWL